MKLRNKKTGEIIDIYKGEITLHYNQGRKTIHFKRLEDLEEWEDYEEPKMFYWIDYDGKICKAEIGTMDRTKIKQVGNYFETKEEAEKAVEKLKAWKRLKDNGFKFLDYTSLGVGEIKFEHNVMDEIEDVEQLEKDLNLLFGGEE